MKLLLTSAGIKNTSIHNALVDLLGKSIAESNALVIPTAIYPFPGGAYMAGRLIRGENPWTGRPNMPIPTCAHFGAGVLYHGTPLPPCPSDPSP